MQALVIVMSCPTPPLGSVVAAVNVPIKIQTKSEWSALSEGKPDNSQVNENKR